jgi:hypothetical protein
MNSKLTSGRGERVIQMSEKAFRVVLWALVAYSMLMLAVAAYDWVRHPFAQSPYNAFQGHPGFRAFALFVGAPIVALLGILILRKQHDNVVGLLLLAWAGGFGSYAISIAIQTALYNIVSFPITAW